MEEAAFLRAILDDPDDEAARLVCADWLEERGDRRAAWLRFGSEVWRLARKGPTAWPGYGDVWRVRRRLRGREPSGRLDRLWACACVRFLPLGTKGTWWEDVRSEALRHRVSAIELAACGLALPPGLPAGPADDPDKGEERLCGLVERFVRSDDYGTLAFFLFVGRYLEAEQELRAANSWA